MMTHPTPRYGCDPNRVKVFGDGLEKGIVDEPNTFTIETKNAGAGGLGLAIEGPSEALMQCEDNKDGTATGKGGKLEKVLGCVNPASCVSFLRVLSQPVYLSLTA